jgi:hypothetical protein
MSAQNSRSQSTAERPVSPKISADVARHSSPAVIEKIEVAQLRIDESRDVDGDPYNCTGRFLADAIKAQYED